jgi:hypothetical protein
VIRTPLWFPWLVGIVLILAGIPLDDGYGLAASLLGMAFVLVGYLRVKARHDTDGEGH